MTELPYSIERDGAVGVITLNRPEKRNALGHDFWFTFGDAIRDLDASGDIRAVVIQSTGPVFCAGIDLQMLASDARDKGAPNAGLAFMDHLNRLQDAFNALEDMRVPVIAAVQGKCVGGAVDMITACDIRLCTEDASFSVFEVNVGMTADVGTFPRLLNHLPEGIVRELSYTGRFMPAAEAAQFGLVNRVLPDHAAVNDAALSLAHEIATKAPMAVHGCKRAITHARDHTTAETLEWIGLWNASMLQRSEVMAAMAAKQTGQPGEFTPLPARNTGH